MARYQVILAYDGTEFAGFQRQHSNTRTVQGEVEAALRQLGWSGGAIMSAGRTDTGVHASGQVIAFDLEWGHPLEALCQALNARLPSDIAVQAAQVAADHFHPRYAARARRYCYTIFCQALRDPLRERFAWRVWPPVEIERLHAAASLLPGSHDFASFGTPFRAGGSTIRTIFQAGWKPDKEALYFEIQANAFLYHMVRRMVFLQVLLGQGQLELKEFEQGLSNGQQLSPGLAPAHGLALVEVVFQPSFKEIG